MLLKRGAEVAIEPAPSLRGTAAQSGDRQPRSPRRSQSLLIKTAAHSYPVVAPNTIYPETTSAEDLVPTKLPDECAEADKTGRLPMCAPQTVPALAGSCPYFPSSGRLFGGRPPWQIHPIDSLVNENVMGYF